jgi:N-acetylglucosaminyl-diphospho-decaprenol L-rhamnosyltransferase
MIYFVTVNYYSSDFIKILIASLQTGITSPYELLIINNSPEDVAVHQLAGEKIHVIEAGDNLGFGNGCNLGIKNVWQRDSQGLVWLINPDATLDQGADHHIQQCFLENPDIAILGTKILSTDGDTWFAEGTFNPWTGSLKHHNRPIHSDQTSALSRSVQWVTGCSFIINLSQFKQQPEFDKTYFLYAEDTDFCLRYAKQGYSVAVTNQALASHKVSSIIGRNKMSMYKNYTFGRLLLLKKHGTILGLLIYFLYSLIIAILYLPIKNDQSRGRLQGTKQFLRLKTRSHQSF